MGAQLWLGGTVPDGTGTCRAVCGLTMLAVAALGETWGRLIGGSLWVGAGLSFILVGVAIAWRRT